MLAIPAFGLAVLSPHIAEAQGSLYLSSLGLTPSGSSSVGSDSWLAADFVTGSNAGGYLLNSVQLGLAYASGNPNGFKTMLYTEVGAAAPFPGTSLGTLDGSLNPAIGGIYIYSPDSDLALSPNTAYFIVLTAGTAVANGAYGWSFTSTHAPTLSGGWHGDDAFLSSSDGLNWHFNSAYAQFGISATDVPEPSMLGLLALGGLLLVWLRQKAKAL